MLFEVLKHDVQPAVGCTEPVAVALACSVATQAIMQTDPTFSPAEILEVSILSDSGVMKNGAGVTIPNSQGRKGIKIAAALGITCGKPDLGLELLKGADCNSLEAAEALFSSGKIKVGHDPTKTGFMIKVTIKTSQHVCTAIVEGSHTNLVFLVVDGKSVDLPSVTAQNQSGTWADTLKGFSLDDLIKECQRVDTETERFLLLGAQMNLALSRAGLKLPLIGQKMREMMNLGIVEKSTSNKIKMTVTAATDARMSGVPLPAMSSGGSGNQGIVAILVPYLMGRAKKVPANRIAESIAFSHLVNSFIKCYSGKLSAMCGCAIAAGVGAAAAIVYQQTDDTEIIGSSMNNVLAMIAGLLCDGAKNSCSLKVASSADAVITSSELALAGFTLGQNEGIVSSDPLQTISQLGQLCAASDGAINSAVLSILTANS